MTLCKTNFGILLDDQEITSLDVDTKDILGIQITELKPPGLVSLLEEYNTKSEGGYNIFEWEKLDPIQKAVEVAHYRIRKAIEYQQYKKSENKIETPRGNNGV